MDLDEFEQNVNIAVGIFEVEENMYLDVENPEPEKAVESQKAMGAREREARGSIFGALRRYEHGDDLAFAADDCKPRNVRTERIWEPW